MNKINLLITANFLVLLLFVSSGYTFGQYVYDYKRSADNFYSKGNYYSAAQYYEKYLTAKSGPSGGSTEPYTVQMKGRKSKGQQENISNQEMVFRIAESYRQINDFSHAEKYYAEGSKFDKTKYPYTTFWYGVSLRSNGKYDLAQEQFEDFLKSNKQNNSYTQQAKIELANCKFISEQLKRKDANLYKINKIIGSSNNQEANYAASMSDNTIVFTSTRPDSTLLKNKNKNPYVNTLYASSPGGNSVAEKLNIPLQDNMDQGVASFSADGTKMYLTRWVKKEGGNLSAIYTSDKVNGVWSAPVKMGSEINAEGFSTQQPFITPDNKYLLFASDRPGGSGKFDLWYAPLQNGVAGKAINMGKTINTKDDDQAPYYHQQTGTLVFASKGRVGMGGFDLYSSKGSPGSSWSEPQNLGYPVNSNKDDIYFYNKGNSQLLSDAIISSDRASECCLELYSVNKTYKKYISGSVVDCKTNQPIPGVNVALNNGDRSSTVTTGEGNYLFTLESVNATDVSASKDEYANGSSKLPVDNGGDTIYNAPICLTLIEKPTSKGEPLVVEEKKEEMMVLFDFAKYDLRPETQVRLDTIAAIMNRENGLSLEIVGYTDNKGTTELNSKLSQERAEACKQYLIRKGVPASRLKSSGKGACCPVQPESNTDGTDNPDGRQANRRVEFKINLLR